MDELGVPVLSDEKVYEHLKYALNTPYAIKHLENLVNVKREQAVEAGGSEVVETAG